MFPFSVGMDEHTLYFLILRESLQKYLYCIIIVWLYLTAAIEKYNAEINTE